MRELSITKGSSREATALSDFGDESRRTTSQTMSRDRIVNQTFDVARECANPGWDGYAANPVSEITFLRAVTFLRSLPDDIPDPTANADPDGALTFEWRVKPRWSLTVGIEPNGDLTFAALLGRARRTGSGPPHGSVLHEVSALIRRLLCEARRG
ncbi:MAG: hypothetical protein HY719_10135 [Planctomycetes bacterium]|nr:hypothetical protein [Planctomycetota bacterium]